MAELTVENLESVLRLIADAGSEPWYPKLYAETSAVPRDSLDEPLEKLRLAGLVKLTDWVKDRGQGYVLTQQGTSGLQDARMLARVRDGKIKRELSISKPAARPRWSSWDRGEAIREVFIDPPDPVVAKTILFITALLFVMGLYVAHRAKIPYKLYLSGDAAGSVHWSDLAEVKHQFGGLTALDLLRGQWWRLLTYLFLHHGVMHLVMNMAALFFLGRYAEPMWGHVRFLLIYLISGWGAGCIAMMISPLGLLGGASGSLCGILASEGVWIYLNRDQLGAPLFRSMMKNVFVNVVLIVMISAVPGVSAAGHFGGAAVGAIAAVLLHFQRYGRGPVRVWASLGLFLLPLGCAAVLIFTLRHSLERQESALPDDKAAERNMLAGRYNSDVAKVFQESRKACAEAVSLVSEPDPKNRNPEARQRALEDLEKSQADLKTALETFNAGLTIRDSNNEEFRRLITELLAAQLSLLEFVDQLFVGDTRVIPAETVELARRRALVNDHITALQDRGFFKKN
jgi:rhomboid protease GluP